MKNIIMIMMILGVLGIFGIFGCSTPYQDVLPEYQIPMIKAVQEQGYCIQKSLKLSEELNKRNLAHRLRIGKRYHEDKDTHAWVEVYKGNDRYILDPSFNWIYKNPIDKYFDIRLK